MATKATVYVLTASDERYGEFTVAGVYTSELKAADARDVAVHFAKMHAYKEQNYTIESMIVDLPAL